MDTHVRTTFSEVRFGSVHRRTRKTTHLHSSTLPLSYLILPPFLRYPFFTKIFCWLMSWHGTIKSFVLKLKPWLPSCLDKITPARPTKTTVDNVTTFHNHSRLFTIYLYGIRVVWPTRWCWWECNRPTKCIVFITTTNCVISTRRWVWYMSTNCRSYQIRLLGG